MIEDEDVPLGNLPDDVEDEIVDLEDEDVPLGDFPPEDNVVIEDEDVPLGDNPETGDALPLTWVGTAATAVAGLFGARNKKKDDPKK